MAFQRPQHRSATSWGSASTWLCRRFGGYRIYTVVDTVWFAGLEDLLQPFAVDVARPPHHGNLPERRVAGNLNPEEAPPGHSR